MDRIAQIREHEGQIIQLMNIVRTQERYGAPTGYYKRQIKKHETAIRELWKARYYMNFGQALEALKAGKKVTREAWSGEWIVLMPSLHLPPFSTQEPGPRVNDRTAKHIGVDTPLDSQPYIAQFTADQKWQPGWVSSQADILAEDWSIVEGGGNSHE